LEKEIEKYNWKYFYKDISKHEIEIKIITDKDFGKPEFLYKFYSLSERSIDSLINKKIYAAHPSQFNDLFDCNEDLISFDDDNVIKNFLYGIIPLSEIEKQISSDRSEIERFVKVHFNGVLYRKWGIFSLTSEPNNIVMWSYYNDHKGFCVEFDFTKFQFKHYGPFPINYQSKIEPISIKDAGPLLSVIYQTNIKSLNWSHENEWRIIIDAGEDVMVSPNFEQLKKLGGSDRKFDYPIEAIKSITLGNRFFTPEEIIKLNNSKLKFILKSENSIVKDSLLNFITENKIETCIAIRNKDLLSIGFAKGKLEKIDKFQYFFYAG
jgi:hypothetical protein